MNHPPRDSNDVQGASVYSTPTTEPTVGNSTGTSNVRVYDRPDKPQGVNMMTIALMLIALVVVAGIIWSVMM